MPESLHTRLYRWVFNIYPAYRGTGAWVTYIADDWREIHICLPLSWQTRNIVGTIFGGSLYASVDPFYMIMLMHNLGPGFTVWDKAATIRFKKPGKTRLFARFILKESELQAIRSELLIQPRLDRVYRVELVDAAGEVHAWVDKTIYLANARANLD